MIILGIETSCDETAMSVIEVTTGNKIKILSNVISSQIKLHAKYGGVVPSLAAREHVKNIKHVFNLALKDAGIKDFKNEIDIVAVTRGPGLGPALLVGLTFAKTIAWLHNKPLVGVSHLKGHIHSNWLSGEDMTKFFPALGLIVSGGHTELILMKSHGQYEIVGETVDDAVGEAFDKVARLLDLGYPGGPAISKIAKKGNPDKYPLPRPMAKSKDYNFSYSGLKTAVLYLLRDLKIDRPDKQTKADIAASFQKAAIDVLVQKTMRAAKEFKVKSVLLSGGVSANELLRSELKKNTTEAGIKYFQPPMEYTTDNAVMIAVAGYFEYKKNKKTALWQSVIMEANLGF
ncbi:MAG: putative tRNA threonylcarbamoyladenosine biosynthesis protein Gcp [Candidatus Yanofskybacteria bacterium GW2011_GWA1_39_13]|uniref:tRNA N6-adenosine threonylcarbamoyltransferase n=1 Tax=Yanofskybacteria sp. (strain GW2011_GWA1_39_13) TaxID=1619019 RepID=A0A0G0MH91_YANXG|nr:MAG: putative tRNA threonylcarbamoyladenosine biosynthesis protein Gcp [Candidatus Yanofskybacteria bacterium GW2011_GWA1_39_13]